MMLTWNTYLGRLLIRSCLAWLIIVFTTLWFDGDIQVLDPWSWVPILLGVPLMCVALEWAHPWSDGPKNCPPRD